MTMKKLVALILALAMCLSLCACGGGKDTGKEDSGDKNHSSTNKDKDEGGEKDEGGNASQLFPDYDDQDLESMLTYIKEASVKVQEKIAKETDSLIEKLGDSHKTYNSEKVAEYYSLVYDLLEGYFADMQEVYIAYYKCVAAQGVDEFAVWDPAMTDLEDLVDDVDEILFEEWEAACDKVYDACDVLLNVEYEDPDYDKVYEQWTEMYNADSDFWDKTFDMQVAAWDAFTETYWGVYWAFDEGETDVDAILKAIEENAASSEEPADAEAEVSGEIRPEFAAAMESYREFCIECAEVLRAYMENPDDEERMAAVEEWIALGTEKEVEFDEWGMNAENDAELAYYEEVDEYTYDLLSEAMGW